MLLSHFLQLLGMYQKRLQEQFLSVCKNQWSNTTVIWIKKQHTVQVCEVCGSYAKYSQVQLLLPVIFYHP
jgi:transcription elongation factor Elf1